MPGLSPLKWSQNQSGNLRVLSRAFFPMLLTDPQQEVLAVTQTPPYSASRSLRAVQVSVTTLALSSVIFIGLEESMWGHVLAKPLKWECGIRGAFL